MDRIKKVTILDEGMDNKVLVQWLEVTTWDCGETEVDIEYSIHTKGANHTEEEYDLVWGQYFGDDYKHAKGTFQYYTKDGEIFREIIEEVKSTVEKWTDDENTWINHEYHLDHLSICNGNEDEVWTFSGDGYRYLEQEYKDSCLDSFVDFEDYVIYSSQNW